ncbi:MAG: peptidase M14, partial [Thiotrichales bacterium]|nr:peptidase M14 [Thiotrichales bacterium]
YFIRPKGVQSMAFAEFCPAVTIECGASGEPGGIRTAGDYLKTCLNLESIPDHTINSRDLDLYHTVAIVKIPREIDFGFDASGHDLVLDPDIEVLNFQTLPEGKVLGRVNNGDGRALEIRDEQGNEVFDQYFNIDDDQLRLRRDIVPAMITIDHEAIRKDCFFYIMERYPL